jgi:hypothetical protein
MNLELKDISSKLQPTLSFAKRYVTLLFIVAMLLVFGFLVFRINQFSNLEPSEDAITEKLQSVQRPRLDQTVIDKIQQLQDQNIEAKALFDQARNNPFSE